MIVKNIKKNIYNKKYLEDREVVWDNKLKDYKDKGIPLWNGSVYYLDEFAKDSISIGLCEYKDLVFLEVKKVKDLKEEYNLNFDFIYINVQVLIVDKQCKYLFGTKHNKDYIEIISVGGTLRFEDGNQIEKFEDIVDYAKKEISIETKIKIDLDSLKYKDMIIDSSICTFLFEYNIDVIEDNLLNIGEFDGFVIIEKSEIFSKNKFMAGARLKSLQDFL